MGRFSRNQGSRAKGLAIFDLRYRGVNNLERFAALRGQSRRK
jgi:hypothetical protein